MTGAPGDPAETGRSGRGTGTGSRSEPEPEPEPRTEPEPEPRAEPARGAVVVGQSAGVVVTALVAGIAGSFVVSTVLGSQAVVRLDIAVQYVVAWFLGGLAPAVAVVWVMPTAAARSRVFRGFMGAFALACVAATAYATAGVNLSETALRWGWASLTLMLAAVALSALMAARPFKLRPMTRQARLATLAICVAFTVGWGSRSMVFAWEEFQEQELPEFTLELVAAYNYEPELSRGGMPAVVVDGEGTVGDIITVGERRFNIHRSNSLSISTADVRRVRWLEDEAGAMITIRLSPQALEAFDDRTRSRSSQYDAVLLDGEVALMLFHFGSADRLILSDRDVTALRRVYRRLTEVR